MSSEVDFRKSDIVIKVENHEDVQKAILALQQKEDFWASNFGRATVSGPYILDKLFNLFGWESVLDENTADYVGLNLIQKDGLRKISSADRLLFDTIAPFVQNGGFLEFQNHWDHEVIFRLVFWNGEVQHIDGRIEFDMPNESETFHGDATYYVGGLEAKDIRDAYVAVSSVFRTNTLYADARDPLWGIVQAPNGLELVVKLGNIRATDSQLNAAELATKKALSYFGYPVTGTFVSSARR